MLIINNDEVAQLLTMADCIRIQEEAFKKIPTGGSIHRPRIDMYMPCEREETIFESSHLPLRLWLQVIYLMCSSKKGIATRQIQRMLQCSMKTAWFLTHRVREAMKDGQLGPWRSGSPTKQLVRKPFRSEKRRIWRM